MKYYGAQPHDFIGELQKGSKGEAVKLLQELLCLHDFNIVIDGDFGPATERALIQYSERKSLGYISKRKLTLEVWSSLMTPISNALSIPFSLTDVSLAIPFVARRHLEMRSREIGGENMGPWVRLYCKGEQGVNYPWCAGFVSFILKQVGEYFAKTILLPYSLSCDVLGKAAKSIFESDKPSLIPPGSIFLINKSKGDWVHTGFVVDSDDKVLYTIEGNTNIAGSREGVAVMSRIRSRKNNIHIIPTTSLFQ